MNTKLNRLKKSDPEAFFYWYKFTHKRQSKITDVQQYRRQRLIIESLVPLDCVSLYWCNSYNYNYL